MAFRKDQLTEEAVGRGAGVVVLFPNRGDQLLADLLDFFFGEGWMAKDLGDEVEERRDILTQRANLDLDEIPAGIDRGGRAQAIRRLVELLERKRARPSGQR